MVLMTMIDEALKTAVQYHRAGQLEEAERIYRQVLQADPGQPDALHLVGLLASQRGDDELAVEYIERAIRGDEHQASFHGDLARALYRLGRFAEAIFAYQRALRLTCGSSRITPRRSTTSASRCGRTGGSSRRRSATAAPWNSGRTTPRPTAA
jgi:Tfp pilus assembly protein PilF